MSKATAVVLISGGGTNLQSMIDASVRGEIGLDIALVISNVAGAGGIERADRAGIPSRIIENGAFSDRQSFDRALVQVIEPLQPQVIILAGFMRILGTEFVAHFRGRILNIHPSLLPSYPGLHTHQRVLENGDAWHGCTVHFVTEDLDAGPAIIQGRVPVRGDDTAEALAARVLLIEHRIFPLAADLLASGRVQLQGDMLMLDGQSRSKSIRFDAETNSMHF